MRNNLVGSNYPGPSSGECRDVECLPATRATGSDEERHAGADLDVSGAIGDRRAMEHPGSIFRRDDPEAGLGVERIHSTDDQALRDRFPSGGECTRVLVDHRRTVPGQSTVGSGSVILHELEQVLLSRRTADPDESYTARLLQDPVLNQRKIMEEAFEVCLELNASAIDAARTAEEAGDLVYHLLVGLVGAGVSLDAVLAVLEGRRS